MNYLMNKIKGFVVEEDGIGTVEMILILVVLIGIVLVFKDHLNSLVESIFKTINSQAGRV
ncbi:Flp1 family type IVb pilin [Pseudobutyrivibrio xylanivorans]|nr:Flp1 family type IVb pilin [Pseudobutyrivibrio xylanivorans]